MYRNLANRRPTDILRSKNPRVFHGHSRFKPHQIFLRCTLLFIALILLFQFREAINISLTAIAEHFSEATPPDMENTQEIGLQAEPVFQNPELPNGCEATSLCAALNYFGFPADKLEIAYHYLPRADFISENSSYYAPDPEEEYAGDPATSMGFYCFEAPIIQAANNYLQAQNTKLTAVDISGADSDTLKACLTQGMPVIIWATIDYSPQAEYHENFQWYLPNGSLYTPYKNLHCILLTGYNSASFTLCDPLAGRLEIPQDTLMQAYFALGSHAVSFQKTA